MEKKQNKPMGRPLKYEGKALVQRSIRLTDDQWKKVDDAGGVPALRDLIDKWKTPAKGS